MTSNFFLKLFVFFSFILNIISLALSPDFSAGLFFATDSTMGKLLVLYSLKIFLSIELLYRFEYKK